MGKKPKLKLVEASTAVDAVPSALGKSGQKLWQSIMSEYDICDAGGLEMLTQACGAADRVAEYASVIDADGPTVRSKTGVKEHPLLKHELAARSFVVRTLARLGLDLEPIKSVGRPSEF